MIFPEAYKAINFAQCAALETKVDSGIKLVLKRDSVRNLLEISAPHGEWLRFAYDKKARIVRAEAGDGSWVNYGYNENGMLTSAISSSGRQRYYEYAGPLMTAVKDESGNVLVSNEYDHDLIVRQEYANGDLYRFSYVWNSQRTGLVRTLVLLPNGQQVGFSLVETIPGFLLGQ